MTDAEKRRRELEIRNEMARLQREIDVMKSLPTWLQNTKQINFDLEIMSDLTRELGALTGDVANNAAVRGIRNLTELISYMTGQGNNLDYQIGRDLISHFASMFNLTAAQQIQLYELLSTILNQAGNITTQQQWAIQEAIKNLRDSGGLSSSGSQNLRSVTTITEIQANTMLAVLNSIYLKLSEILQALLGAGRNIYGAMPYTISGSVVISGNMNFYPQTSDAKSFARTFVSEMRSIGKNVG